MSDVQDVLWRSLFRLKWTADGNGKRRKLLSKTKSFAYTVSTDGVAASVHLEQLPVRPLLEVSGKYLL